MLRQKGAGPRAEVAALEAALAEEKASQEQLVFLLESTKEEVRAKCLELEAMHRQLSERSLDSGSQESGQSDLKKPATSSRLPDDGSQARELPQIGRERNSSSSLEDRDSDDAADSSSARLDTTAAKVQQPALMLSRRSGSPPGGAAPLVARDFNDDAAPIPPHICSRSSPEVLQALEYILGMPKGGSNNGGGRRVRREKRSMFEIMNPEEILASMPTLAHTIKDPKGFHPTSTLP